MDLELTGRVAIVTGASRGIGFAIAQALATEGARVVICARDIDQLDAARDTIIAATGAEVLSVPADITVDTDGERLIATAIAAYGGIDILVNNAGGSVNEGTPTDRFESAFDLNVVSALRLAEFAHPYLARSEHGALINIASIYGRESGGSAEYNATKSAAIAMTKTLARSWAPEGIRVNAIAPGSIVFEGGSWAKRVAENPEAMREFVAREIPGGRFGRPEEIAAVAAFLASPRASWIIGATINVDGGQSRSNI